MHPLLLLPLVLESSIATVSDAATLPRPTYGRLMRPHYISLIYHFRLRIESSLLLEVLLLVEEHVL